jgi:hypothetical protein
MRVLQVGCQRRITRRRAPDPGQWDPNAIRYEDQGVYRSSTELTDEGACHRTRAGGGGVGWGWGGGVLGLVHSGRHGGVQALPARWYHPPLPLPLPLLPPSFHCIGQ